MAHEMEATDICLVRKSDGPAWHKRSVELDEIRLSDLQAHNFMRPVTLESVEAVMPWGTVKTDAQAITLHASDPMKAEVLHVAGARYTLDAPDGFGAIARVAGKLVDEGLVKIISAGTLRGYRRGYITCEPTERVELEIHKGDSARLLLSFADTLDCSGVRMRFDHLERIVCANTWRLALNQSQDLRRVRHTASLARNTESWADEIRRASIAFKEEVEILRKLAGTQIDAATLDVYLRDAFGIAADVAPADLPVAYDLAVEAHDSDPARGTLWGAFNGAQSVTQWQSRGTRTDSARLDNVFFGAGVAATARMAQAALRLAA